MQLLGKPLFAGYLRRACAAHLVGAARYAALAGGAVDEGFGRGDELAPQQIVVLALQVLAGLLGAVPGAVALELAVGLEQGGEQAVDLDRCGGGRVGVCGAGC